MSPRLLLPFVLLTAVPAIAAVVPSRPFLSAEDVKSTVDRLVRHHGEAFTARIRTGVRQVAERWWPEDGNTAAFATFCDESFIKDEATLAQTFARLEAVLEQIDGHLLETRRELLRPSDLDTGPVSTLDQMLGNLDLQAHVDDDLFRVKVAFVMLLNFPLETLAERLEHGGSWDRETWARSRLMDRFALRVPAAVTQEATRAFTEADRYIADYNIRMDRLVDREGRRLFPDGLRLISHWGLRDELASHYGEAGALPKQRLIQTVMERIVRQEIPVQVIDSPDFLWCPQSNEVKPAPGASVGSTPSTAAREPDIRYEKLLDVYRAVKQADAYAPTAPTFIARRFELDRQIPVKDVEAILVSVLESGEVRALAAEIERRLGRPLEPFDIWYSGFKSRGGRSESELDEIVRSKYPAVSAFQADVPGILVRLGFTKDKAGWLAERIVVDPSRGAGHAMGAVRREDRAHLRTRIPSSGMNYKGYNIAVHELGHNVEQVFSLHGIDRWALYGVPNNGFTEAFAFVFQNRDLELLGLGPSDAGSRGHEALATLWATYEIGGVSLVDMKVWDWMYAHPQATPAQLREATLAIARDVWNRFFAPVFRIRDVELLAIYSHMISNGLYLPDYPLGHIIAFQIAERLRGPDFAAEFERMARQGRLTPDAWMRGAVGEPVSAKALLAEARRALEDRSR